MNKPLYIVIDGVDGSGKGTLIDNIIKNWEWGDLDTYFDPGISHDVKYEKWQTLRHFIKHEEMDSLTETCMFFSLRAELMANVEKSLTSGRHCLQDRGPSSTWVYQGYCKNQIKFIEDFENICPFRKPDILFVLFTSFDTLTERLEKRNNNIDKFKSNEEFRRKVWEGYKQYINQKVIYDPCMIPIDAGGTPEEIYEYCMKIIKKKLNIKN